jgi:threonine/homoserine/homoserine lactone efflux protein
MTYLLLGISLGFSAGLSPGPLLTLVITRSLARGFWAGLRVALSPLITDTPIILLALLLFNALPPLFEQVVTVVGGLCVVYLGVGTIRSARHASLAQQAAQPAAAHVDLWQGALVNILSPHPWLFWITIGAPVLTRAWQSGPSYALAFLVGFYALLVGGKIAVALAVASGRRYLTDAWYRRLLYCAGALLCLFGFLLLWQLVSLIPGRSSLGLSRIAPWGEYI